MNAVILAGGKLPSGLEPGIDAEPLDHHGPNPDAPPERALIDLGGRPLIEHVLNGLRECEEIGDIVVVGNPPTLGWLEQFADIKQVASHPQLSQNVVAGVQAVVPDATARVPVLICTCDIPLATAGTWKEFIERSRAAQLEAAYAIVARDVIEAAFPEGKRTYARLRDGTYTGGNAFILPRHGVDNLTGLIEAAHRARKNPFAIAKLLGPRFLARALTKRLTVVDIERKMSQVLMCRAGAVRMQDAAIAFDVDKLSDLLVLRRIVGEGKLTGRRNSGSEGLK